MRRGRARILFIFCERFLFSLFLILHSLFSSHIISLSHFQHHCRRCGKLVCGGCSEKSFYLDNLEKTARVCDLCYTELSTAGKTRSLIPTLKYHTHLSRFTTAAAAAAAAASTPAPLTSSNSQVDKGRRMTKLAKPISVTKLQSSQNMGRKGSVQTASLGEKRQGLGGALILMMRLLC